jgi:asparagine synthase (glutamine-hydrolysing)
MVDALRHESFYVTGTWIDEALGLYVGWVIRRNSFADSMPLRNEAGEVVLIFSGEEFPEPGTTNALKTRGHVFDGNGPSYLVHVAEEDTTFPAGLNGRFQGLLVNRPSRTATVFNDRYGMHRIYYHESKEGFYFAAEAKALLEVRPELRSADTTGLAEYVSCGCVLENRTIFKDVHVLPPGSAWVFRGGSVDRKTAYFQPKEWEEQPTLDADSYYQQLRTVLTRNLPRYCNGHQRIGMSLTGGLDSRMIMAWWKTAPQSVPCYSFGGIFRDCQDVVIARRVAHACDQPHQVIEVGQDFLSRFPRYAERTVYLTDGCADVSRSADLYVNERAATIAPVRMTGNYGGEVLRGVRAFKPMELVPGLFRPEFFSHVEAARDTYLRLCEAHPVSFAVFRQAPWHHYGLLALEETQLSLRSPYLDNDLVRTVFRAPESVLANNNVCLRLIEDGDAALRRIRTDLGLAGEHSALPEAVSRQLLKFTFKAEYAYDYGMPQWVARIDHLLSPLHLERLFLGRHKFYHYRVWYRDALSTYVREMLLDPRTLSRPYLQRNTAEAIVHGHVKGDRNYTREIHKILSLELIHRTLLDRN